MSDTNEYKRNKRANNGNLHFWSIAKVREELARVRKQVKSCHEGLQGASQKEGVLAAQLAKLTYKPKY